MTSEAKAPTLEERRRHVENQREEVSARLEELVAEKSTLGLSSLEGDEKSSTRLGEIEREIAGLESRRQLVEAARRDPGAGGGRAPPARRGAAPGAAGGMGPARS
jgi:hypothetical protein